MSAVEGVVNIKEESGRKRRQLLSGVIYSGLTLVAVYIVLPQFLGQDRDRVLPLLQSVRPEQLASLLLLESVRYVCFGLVARQIALMLGRAIPRQDAVQMMLGSYALSRIFSLGGAMAFIVRMQFYLRHSLTAGRTLALFITHNVVSGAALMTTYLFGLNVLWSRGELAETRLLFAFGWLVVIVATATTQIYVGLRPGFLERAFQQVLNRLRTRVPFLMRHSLSVGLLLTSVLLVAGLVWWQQATPGVEQVVALVWIAVCFIVGALQVFVTFNPRLKRAVQVTMERRLRLALRSGWHQPEASQKFAQELSGGLQTTLGNRSGMLTAFGFQATGLAADIATLVVAAQALQTPMPVELIVAAYIIAYYAQLIAPTPGEAGAMEFALLGVLIGLGLSPLQATTLTLLFRFVSFWLPIPVGVLTYLNLRRQEKI